MSEEQLQEILDAVREHLIRDRDGYRLTRSGIRLLTQTADSDYAKALRTAGTIYASGLSAYLEKIGYQAHRIQDWVERGTPVEAVGSILHYCAHIASPEQQSFQAQEFLHCCHCRCTDPASLITEEPSKGETSAGSVAEDLISVAEAIGQIESMLPEGSPYRETLIEELLIQYCPNAKQKDAKPATNGSLKQ